MDLSVLVGSCDEYYNLLRNFDILFKKYWLPKTKNFLVTETIPFDNPHYEIVLAGKVTWGQRILTALEQIDTKYVFFILEDYYLSEYFTEERVINHLNLLEKHNGDKIMFEILDREYTLENIDNNLYKFNINSKYLNSVQPSIWKTDFLKKSLSPMFSPWDFETIGNNLTKKLNPTILLNAIPQRTYFNFVRRGGVLSVGWEDFIKKENLII
jgi:hypothetical protein